MADNLELIVIFFAFSVIGFLGAFLAYLYGKKTDYFRWNEYLALIILPLSFIVFLTTRFGLKILSVFFIGSLTGFLAEYLFGFFYDKVLGKRLWTYNRLSLNGYTSLLSLPCWGIGAIVFWFIAKIFGP